MAGALGVQLGGLNYYEGEPHEGPRLGDASRPLRTHDIIAANTLMLETSVLCLMLFIGARAAILNLWGGVA